MSVLTQVMEERASWADRHIKDAVKMRQRRILLDYVVLVAMGVVVYMYHSQLVDVARHIFE